ncbi:MarR family winged helix-turn-helix transcriptional regulator [Achromobacter aloeverae]|uniref:MarR family transcriptional regulator n=1 Tax=Achromobacter aloeverae TaxID=1750518 RepID=A0A4Q1HM51_9BURK|nr:MarR family transcriptional regulator [Achromobacter aloeverae]RXN91571.1 MarR family transcriptional regulator [Achromobacter aloeverae]
MTSDKPPVAAKRRVKRPRPKHLSDMFSYRLNRLAFISSRIAAGINEHRYGIGPREWRIMGLLGTSAPMALNAVAKEANIDKSQASRTVADMIERGLVRRSADEADGRGIRLALTDKGRALFDEMFPAAIERNEAVLSVLTGEERDALDAIMDKLTAHGLEMMKSLKDEMATRRGRGAGPR